MTGGISESYSISSLDYNEFWEYLQKAEKQKSLVTASIDKTEHNWEIRQVGLIDNHEYAITKTDVFNGERLIRLRNPWGKLEWLGPWSDKSYEARMYGLPIADDGEFWMPYEYFIRYFVDVYLVHKDLNVFLTDEYENENGRLNWQLIYFEGQWARDENAGGSEDHESFCTNPQFFINLSNQGVQNIPLVVSLQTSYESQDISKKINIFRIKDDNFIGSFANSHVKFNMQDLTKEYIGYKDLNYERARETTVKMVLQPGYYVIIPYTKKKNLEAKFFLRIFAATKLKNDGSIDLNNLLPSLLNQRTFF